MKTILTLCLFIAMTTACFASDICADVQESVATALEERNTNTTSTFNTAMPDPEEGRDALAGCLGSISTIGDAFTLGVSLPSMDSIISSICGSVDSYIQAKINSVHNQVVNNINSIGDNNPFKVYGTGGDYVVKLKGKLQ